MPIETDERDRLIAIAQSYADSASPEFRVAIEDTGSGVRVRGAWRDSQGQERVETLSISWELVERSDSPEHFLKTQV